MKKTLLFLFMFVAAFATSWAEDVVFDFTNPTGLKPSVTPAAEASNGVAVNDMMFTVGDVAVKFEKGTAGTDCRIWTKTDLSYELRTYKGCKMTISSAREIKSVKLIGGKNTGFTTTVGTFDAGTWTGSSQSIEFTGSAGTNITSIVIGFEATEGGGEVEPVDPSVPVAKTIAELKAMATTTQTSIVFEFTDLLVTYVNKSNMYVTDGKDGILIYGQNGINAVAGDKMSGQLKADLKLYNGGTQLMTPDYANVSITSQGNEIAALEMTMAEFAANDGLKTYEGMMVCFKNVKMLAEKEASTKIPFTDDDVNTMDLYDKFNLIAADDIFELFREYNLTGIVTNYKGAAQLYATAFPELVPSNKQYTEAAFAAAEVAILAGEEWKVDNAFTTKSDATVEYASSNEDVATVSATGAVTVKGFGHAVISAKTAATENYFPGEANFDLYVLQGKGTETEPYTVTDMLYANDRLSAPAYVKGVIIGYYTSKVVEGVPTRTSYNTNMVIGTLDCPVCVQLPAGEVRDALNLVDNPDNLGKEVLLLGDLVTYNKLPGVKNPTNFQFVEATPDPEPEPEPEVIAYLGMTAVPEFPWTAGNGDLGCVYGVNVKDLKSVVEVPVKFTKENEMLVAGTLAGNVYYAYTGNEESKVMTFCSLNFTTGNIKTMASVNRVNETEETEFVVKEITYDEVNNRLLALVKRYDDGWSFDISTIDTNDGTLTTLVALEGDNYVAIAAKGGTIHVMQTVLPPGKWWPSIKVLTVDAASGATTEIYGPSDQLNSYNNHSMAFNGDDLYMVYGRTLYKADMAGNKLVNMGDLPQQSAGLCFAKSTEDAKFKPVPVTATEQINNSSAYVVKSARGYMIYAPTKATDRAWCSNNTTAGAVVEVDENDANNQWAFVKSPESGNVYLWNVGYKKFLHTSDNGATQFTDKPVAGDVNFLESLPVSELHGTPNDNATYPWVIALGENQLNMSVDQANSIFTNWNDRGDVGNSVQIVKVDNFDATEALAAIAEFEFVPEPQPESKLKVAIVEMYGDVMGDSEGMTKKEVSYYDTNNKLVRKGLYGMPNELMRYTVYENNAAGNPTLVYSQQYGVYGNNEAQFVASKDSVAYVYDEAGRLVQEIGIATAQRTDYSYDENGNLVKKERYLAEDPYINPADYKYYLLQSMTFSNFIAPNCPTLMVSESPQNYLCFSTDISYDDAGRKVKEYSYTVSESFDEAQNPIVVKTYKDSKYWNYDETGFLTSVVSKIAEYGDDNQLKEGDYMRTVYTIDGENPNRVKAQEESYFDGEWYKEPTYTITESREFDGETFSATNLTVEAVEGKTNTAKLSFDVPAVAMMGNYAFDVYRKGHKIARLVLSEEGVFDPATNKASYVDAEVANGDYDYFVHTVAIDPLYPEDEVGYNVSEVVKYTHYVELPAPTNVHGVHYTLKDGEYNVLLAWDAPEADAALGFQRYNVFLTGFQIADNAEADGLATEWTANFSNKKATDVYVQAVYKFGKANSETVTVTIENLTAINGQAIGENGTVYANGTLQLGATANVVIYNAAGKVVKSARQAASVNVAELPAGVYVATVQQNGKVNVVKFAK